MIGSSTKQRGVSDRSPCLTLLSTSLRLDAARAHAECLTFRLLDPYFATTCMRPTSSMRNTSVFRLRSQAPDFYMAPARRAFSLPVASPRALETLQQVCSMTFEPCDILIVFVFQFRKGTAHIIETRRPAICETLTLARPRSTRRKWPTSRGRQ